VRKTFSIDLLVAGGGIAGLACAARAAALGLDVLVCEKGSSPGGSGALSAGIVWTAPDFATLRRVAPEGDPALGRALVDGFDAAIDGIRALGVPVSDRWTGQMGFGIAHHVDVPGLLAAWTRAIPEIRLRTAVTELLLESDDAEGRAAVVGARISGPDREADVVARAVVLATGGFQGDPGLVATFLGRGADAMPLRSNPHSAGDGMRLGRAAGGALSGGLSRFYGHLVPDRLTAWGPESFLALTQYHSRDGIVVDRTGRRFTDETLGDETTNQALLRRPGGRGALICDERVRQAAVGAPYPHGQVVDRFAEAVAAGGRAVSAPTLERLAEEIAGWGIDAEGLRATLADFEGESPFHALAVQPSLTFCFGGLRVDADARVLDRDGAPVRGLYAAGADAGGLQGPGYVGGLILGLVFGPRAAEAVARS
jgi:succinate dehydrogenase/fumarate reductase flavoprotein subunit